MGNSSSTVPEFTMVSKAASAGVVVLAVLVRIGSGFLIKWRRGKKYDGLDGVLTLSLTLTSPTSSKLLKSPRKNTFTTQVSTT